MTTRPLAERRSGGDTQSRARETRLGYMETPVRQRILVVCCTLALIAAAASGRPYSEAFDGAVRDAVWTVRNVAAPNSVGTSSGWLHVTVGPDGVLFPWEAAARTTPMLLVEPPSRDGDFSMETRLRVVQAGGVPWGSMAGLGVIRKDGEAAWIWGALESGWIALREYDMDGIVDAQWIALVGGEDVSRDVWLQIHKRGDRFTFRHTFSRSDAWVETKARPWGSPEFPARFTTGDYLIGLIVVGGGEETRVQFDYFDSPALGVLVVDPAGRLPAVWARLRQR